VTWVKVGTGVEGQITLDRSSAMPICA